jgi:Holliday junction resolvase RusA-like endonuclease
VAACEGVVFVTNTIKFTIPGEPLALQRARHGKGNTYDTKANKAAKQKIRLIGNTAMRGCSKPYEGAIKLTILFIHAWPKSYSQKRKNQSNGFYKITKSDIDNQIKLVMDALNGIAWKDDAQVSVIHAEKVHMDRDPCTMVTIEPLWEVDGVEVFL